MGEKRLQTAARERWLWRAVGVRLRFLLLIGLLAGLMAGWPYLRTGWDRVISLGTGSTAQYSVSADSEFFCPMDPGIITAWPAICPICNMDLISRKKTDAVILPAGVLARMQLSPYRVQLAGVRTEPVVTSDAVPLAITIPASAVVHRESGDVVYVETMQGMFDAVPVKLKSATGNDRYEVEKGLVAGQSVVVSGAFLLDAETRLNPSIATQYFGANHQHAAASISSSRRPTLAKAKVIETTPLSQADQKIVDSQKICPVTEAPLGSMGQPVFVLAGGRRVALCCKGCERALLAEPDKYLAVLAVHQGAP